MKNKTKKILAAACLGLVGAATLTGCSMSAEDMEKWETKADTVIEALSDANEKLTEQNDKYAEIIENLQKENAKITKKEALEKIILARQKWQLMQFNQIKLDADICGYEGLFDEKLESGSYSISHGTMIYRNENNTKIYNESFDDNSQYIYKSDFTTDIHYGYVSQGGEEGFVIEEYKKSIWSIGGEFDFGNYIAINSITEDNIYDIEVIEGGYKVTVRVVEVAEYNPSPEADYVDVRAYNTTFDISIVDGNIISVEGVKVEAYTTVSKNVSPSIIDKDDDGNYLNSVDEIFDRLIDRSDDISCDNWTFNYEYENIDFTELDAKIAAIETEYLTNE